MAKNVEIRMDIEGCRELRNSGPIQEATLSACYEAVGRAMRIGAGIYGADVKPGKTRAIGRVRCMDDKSYKDNSKNNTLLKSIKG
jgi:hypothetical protein